MKKVMTFNLKDFEKAQVKGFTRTRKGKMERVKPFSRKGEAKPKPLGKLMPAKSKQVGSAFEWYMRGGHRGKTIIADTVDRFLNQGFTPDTQNSSASPDGNYVGWTKYYRNPRGDSLEVSANFGPTKEYNSYHIVLRPNVDPNKVKFGMASNVGTKVDESRKAAQEEHLAEVMDQGFVRYDHYDFNWNLDEGEGSPIQEAVRNKTLIPVFWQKTPSGPGIMGYAPQISIDEMGTKGIEGNAPARIIPRMIDQPNHISSEVFNQTYDWLKKLAPTERELGIRKAIVETIDEIIKGRGPDKKPRKKKGSEKEVFKLRKPLFGSSAAPFKNPKHAWKRPGAKPGSTYRKLFANEPDWDE